MPIINSSSFQKDESNVFVLDYNYRCSYFNNSRGIIGILKMYILGFFSNSIFISFFLDPPFAGTVAGDILRGC